MKCFKSKKNSSSSNMSSDVVNILHKIWEAIEDINAVTGLNNIVEDETPQLGGILDGNGYAINLDIENGGNDVALTITQNDITNNPDAMQITNAGTGSSLYIDQNGATGSDPTGSAALKIDNTGNAGSALLIYSNYAGAVRQDGLVYIRVDHASYDGPILRIKSDSSDSEGLIRLDGPSPEIEYVETDQSAPAGKWETRVQGDRFQINSRATGDSTFEKLVGWNRTADGGTMQLVDPDVGEFHDFDYARISILSIHTSTLHYFAISSSDDGAGEGVPDGDIFIVTGDGNIGIGIESPDTILDVNGAITQREISADPSDPDEGSNVIWQDDGGGSGDDGDIMMKITAGGSTKTITLVDFSAS